MKKFFGLLIAVLLTSTSSYAKQQSKKVIVLSSDNTLSLTEEFNRETVSVLMQSATKMDANLKSGYPMFLFMSTPGGSIQAGLELIEFFEGLNRPVHTITLFSASMGWQTVQHLGERYIMKYGVLMSHKARGSFSGEFGGGLSQLDSRYKLWLGRVRLMDQKTVSRTKGKQSMKTYTAAYTPELWLSGADAVRQGYADAVVTVKCDASLQGTKTKTLDYGFYKVHLELSSCPMKSAPLEGSASLMTNRGEMPLDEFLLNNGKFGKKCRESDVIVEDSSYLHNNPTVEKAELCAMDKSLTITQLRKAIEQRLSHANRNPRDHIVYSY